MSLLRKLLTLVHNPNTLGDEMRRKYQLIHAITLELFLFGIILFAVNIYLRFWTISSMLFIGTVLVLGNLILLRKRYNLVLCGHIITSLALGVTVLGNLWLGGISTSYFGWFYVSPLIAAITLGIDGLIIYSLLSASIIVIFIYGQFTPIYFMSDINLNLINTINHVLILFIIFTTLYSLLKENKQYETLLKEQNYLLNADKQKFHYLSYHDSLTNLPNRAYFHNHLQTMIDSINDKNNTIALYFMDLDGFKLINDQYGHEVGDLLLLLASKRLQACFRANDFIARLGGDEFTAIITYNTKEKVADAITKRVEQEFQMPFLIKDLIIKCNVSIGRANYPQESSNSEILLKLADEAMYENKKMKRLTTLKHLD